MKKFLALFLSLALVLSLAACGGKEEAPAEKPVETPSEAPAETPDAAEKALDVDEVVFGIVGPQTGASYNLGVGQAYGVELAVEHINAKGGILGVPVRCVSRDDESDPTKSLTYTEELVLKEGAHVLLGQANSACAAATADFTTEEEILVLHHGATSASVIDPELYPYSFRVHASNDSQANGLVNLAVGAGFDNVVLLGDTSDLGVTGIASLEKYAADRNLAVAGKITYVAGDADLSPVANAIKETGSKCILTFGLGVDMVKIVEALNRIDYLDDVTIIGYSGALHQSLGEMSNTMDLSRFYGVTTAELCIPAGQDELYAPVQELYEEINERWGVFTADGSGRTWAGDPLRRAYEATMMAAWAIEQTGSVEGPVLAEYIEQHGAEYVSAIYPNSYEYSETNHEGYNPENIVAIQVTGLIDDGVKYFGDVYQGATVAPMS